jgi:hypothetical protein
MGDRGTCASRAVMAALMNEPQNVWQKGLSPEEAKALEKGYQQRYGGTK